MIKNIFSLMIIIQINLLALSNCVYKNEYSRGSSIARTGYDYTNKVSSGTHEAYNNFSKSDGWRGTSCSNGTFGMWHYERGSDSRGSWRGGNVFSERVLWEGGVHHEISWGWWAPHGISSGFVAVSCYKQVPNTPTCPSGWTNNGSNCKKAYTYYTYTCSTAKNPQGFNWVVSNGGGTSSRSSTPPNNNCSRKYQECPIECETGFIYEPSSGKCFRDYEEDCRVKDMTYVAEEGRCIKGNRCENENAYKDELSNKCIMNTACNVVNGVCGEDAINICEDTTFAYSEDSGKCEKRLACSEDQITLPDGTCGSRVFCEDGSIETPTRCKKTTEQFKTCGIESRDANVCYEQNSGESNFTLSYRHPLERVELSGAYKKDEYERERNSLCNDDNGKCTFRMTKIYADDEGKKLCFKDSVSGNGCISISGQCTVTGTIESEEGIRQLFIGDDMKSIVAYNKAVSNDPLGAITSNCVLSGKVGHIDAPFNSQEIIAAKGDGLDIVFWDSYRRGKIGVISFLPTIPAEDSGNGYRYEDEDVMNLFLNGFTAFYTADGKTYATHKNLISQTACVNAIANTSFYLAQAETEEEKTTLNMLSLLGEGQYSYNGGDLARGACVVKSNTAISFNDQFQSKKTVNLGGVPTKFACSTLDCKDGNCQFNQCPSGFEGAIFEPNIMVNFITDNPTIAESEVCTQDSCDSNKPYLSQCGNLTGCETKANIFLQSNGSCVEVICSIDETLNIETGACEKLGCKDSIERDGRCYKTLEL